MSKKNDLAWDTVYEPFLNGKRKPRRTNPAQDRTAIIEAMYTRILFDLCMNRFKWTGTEASDTMGISVRFMELTLMRFGLAVVFNERSTGKVIAMQGTPSGQWNWFQDPVRFTVIGNTFGSKTLTTKECVPVWSNYMRMPDVDIVYVYARRLAELDRTIEINTANARRTRIAFTNENQKNTVANINKQIDEGDALFTLNIDQYTGETMNAVLGTVDLGVDPDSIVNLHILRVRLWGECMGLLGFDYANQDKKERLVAAEVDANNSQVDGMRAVNLNARRDACNAINAKYGTQLWVDYHITTETSEAIPAPPTVGAGA